LLEPLVDLLRRERPREVRVLDPAVLVDPAVLPALGCWPELVPAAVVESRRWEFAEPVWALGWRVMALSCGELARRERGERRRGEGGPAGAGDVPRPAEGVAAGASAERRGGADAGRSPQVHSTSQPSRAGRVAPVAASRSAASTGSASG
jgi:hypothetical protein